MINTLSRWIAVVAIVASPIVSAATMTPGLWSLDLTADSSGRIQKMPPVQECISQQDIDDPVKTLPRPDGKCTLSNVKRTDERATYDLACMNGALLVQGRADIRFDKDRYDGSVTMTGVEHGAAPESFNMRISARRVGECTK